jgi:hypothetical protein
MDSKPTLYSRLFPKQPLYPKVTHCHMPVFDTVRMGALHARRRALQEGIKAIDAELARLVELEQLKAFAHYQQVLTQAAQTEQNREHRQAALALMPDSDSLQWGVKV